MSSESGWNMMGKFVDKENLANKDMEITLKFGKITKVYYHKILGTVWLMSILA